MVIENSPGSEELTRVESGATNHTYTGTGGGAPVRGGKQSVHGKLKKSLPVVAIVAVVAVGAVGVFSGPFLAIGGLDFGLQSFFSNMNAVLTAQAQYALPEMLAKGAVPSGFADSLAANGIDVGQVTAKGDFVRTNSYIANLDEQEELAATGSLQVVSDELGQLAIRFKDKVITAADFIAVLESDPELRLAYDDAADIVARFNYSDEVNKIYKDELNVPRGAYANWKSTGDNEKDTESFREIWDKVLDDESRLSMNGFAQGESDITERCVGQDGLEQVGFCLDISASDSATAIVDSVAKNTKGSQATAQGAELLNMGVSAVEPYGAVASYVMTESILQQARIEGTGPVNQLMNTLTIPTTVTYVDVNTGDEVTETKSVLETTNFAATVSSGSYSKSEAANFSRDRVLKATSMTGNGGVIGNTLVASNGKKHSNILMMMSGAGAADEGVLNKATDSVSMALVESNSSLFSSVVGGNRLVEGGLFLASTLSMQGLGAMPSDAEAIVAYNHETQNLIAQKAAAERAVLSPFDISSPNTMLGSVARKVATATLKSLATRGSLSVNSALGVATNLLGDAIHGIVGGAKAEGEDYNDALTIFGDYCETPKVAANVEGDLYCTPHVTLTTKYMNLTSDDWSEMVSEDEFEKFVLLAMNRSTTVGVKDAEVCKRAKQEGEASSGIFGTVLDVFGIRDACDGVSDEVAIGAAYAISSDNVNSENIEKYSAKATHDVVYALLEEKQSSVAMIKENYYAKYPRDNSAAGRLARISGMSKDEAEVALGYSAYLAKLSEYNPIERYAFGVREVLVQPVIEATQAKIAMEGVYCVWCSKTEYDDVKNEILIA